MKAKTQDTRSVSRPLRCAIYTRKSTEQGLDQEFSSLDNQREAAEAYMKSQAHEGWRMLPERYDDGGFSGGSLDRPALQRLLGEVRAGRVDVIVVYKVDRLTRSLADFAKLIELFDDHKASFVSVTQAFNTTSSMGRLTLNVLLSFAQFEREVTGERIRDKIAATKKKGKRAGGPVPLGYQLQDKKLVPCPTEAEQVRHIFRSYLDLGSLRAVLRGLDSSGMVTKLYTRRHGSRRGGVRFNASGLSYLLRNRCYVGEVIHKGLYYPGEHPGIVPQELFEAVAASLASKSPHRLYPNANRDSLLKGLLHDAHGHRMTPTSSKSRGPLYRYYISRPAIEGRKDEVPGRFRVSAPEIEAKVLAALGLDQDKDDASHAAQGTSPAADAPTLREQLLACVDRVTLLAEEIRIERKDGSDGAPRTALSIPWQDKRYRTRRAIVSPFPDESADAPMPGAQRARLVQGIANARLWLAELADGVVSDPKAIADREGCSERHVRMVLNLAFLPPAIVKAAVDGTLQAGAGVVSLSELPPCWVQP